MATALPMQIFYKVFKPFIHALDWASAKTVQIFGSHADSEHASIYTEDEIRQLIRISEESGHRERGRAAADQQGLRIFRDDR